MLTTVEEMKQMIEGRTTDVEALLAEANGMIERCEKVEPFASPFGDRPEDRPFGDVPDSVTVTYRAYP